MLIWPVGQVVKTEASHAFNIGSNPVRVTKKSLMCEHGGFLSVSSSFFRISSDAQKIIRENINDLLNNFDAITITKREKSFLNGGCTEPHVSYVLSARLSSRPVGWSRKTLRRFAPILAAGAAAFVVTPTQEKKYPRTAEFLIDPHKRFLPNTGGLADPDHAVTFPARQNKVTPLFNALKPF